MTESCSYSLYAPDLALTSDGSTAFVTTVLGDNWRTIAYDVDTGTPLWARTAGVVTLWDDPAGLAVSPDDTTVVVTGIFGTVQYFEDFMTIAYDAATGATLWASRYSEGQQAFDDPKDVAFAPDGGRVFVTGMAGSGHVTTLAYDPATGAQLWVAEFPWRGGGFDEPSAVVVSPDSQTVFVALTADSADPEWMIVAYDAASGVELWARKPLRPRSGHSAAMASSPDGSRLFATGGVGAFPIPTSRRPRSTPRSRHGFGHRSLVPRAAMTARSISR